MRRPSKYYAEVFLRVVSDASAENLDVLVDAFIKLLARENALPRLHQVIRLICAVLDREQGGKDITIITAAPLTASALCALQDAARTSGFGGVQSAVDSELCGGAILQARGHRVDKSIVGALDRLYETLVR